MAEPSPEAVAAEIKAWYFRIDNPRSIETVGQITEAHIEKALDFMRDNAGALAKAKAERGGAGAVQKKQEGYTVR